MDCSLLTSLARYELDLFRLETIHDGVSRMLFVAVPADETLPRPISPNNFSITAAVSPRISGIGPDHIPLGSTIRIHFLLLAPPER